jgi:hypothetical protein
MSSLQVSGNTPTQESEGTFIEVISSEIGTLEGRKVVGGCLVGVGTLLIIGAIALAILIPPLGIALGAVGLGLAIPGIVFLAKNSQNEEPDPIQKRKEHLPILMQECQSAVDAIMENYPKDVSDDYVTAEDKKTIAYLNHKIAEFQRELDAPVLVEKVETVKATVLSEVVIDEKQRQRNEIMGKYKTGIDFSDLLPADQAALLDLNRTQPIEVK